jgi:hypothetical protein
MTTTLACGRHPWPATLIALPASINSGASEPPQPAGWSRRAAA